MPVVPAAAAPAAVTCLRAAATLYRAAEGVGLSCLPAHPSPTGRHRGRADRSQERLGGSCGDGGHRQGAHDSQGRHAGAVLVEPRRIAVCSGDDTLPAQLSRESAGDQASTRGISCLVPRGVRGRARSKGLVRVSACVSGIARKPAHAL